VLAANHSSYLDAAARLAAVPGDFRFVAKRELAARPIIGTVLEKAAHPTVERAALLRSVADAERVAARLRAGDSLLFFPEGTFVREPGILPFRLGAFKAAVDAGCPVVPVAIRGTRQILHADTRLPKPGRIAIVIGEPLVPGADEWREMVRLRDLARSEIARLAGERLV
jgi:1-acyl-sn-glycerol-3-phosphate acyltransferase